MNTIKIRQYILYGIRCVPPTEVTEADLDLLIERVVERKPEDLKGYSYIVGRNWAVDTVRRKAAALRKQVAAEEAARKAAEATVLRNQCLREFNEICEQLELSLSSKERHMLHVVRLAEFQEFSTMQLCAVFPEVKACTIYQWRSRGRKIIRQHCSKQLSMFLGGRKVSKKKHGSP